MLYRKFGNTGINISALGFGCMRFPMMESDGKKIVNEELTIPMLRRAVELGVNYFDTAYNYCEELSQATVGKALKPYRDKVYIATKIPLHLVNEPSDYRNILLESLRRLDTEYIDFYHFHGIDKGAFDKWVSRDGMNLIGEAVKAKEDGLIRHISFSFHSSPEDMQYMIERAPELETVLAQYNIIDRTNESGFAFAKSKGMGVVAMGPVAGGGLAAPAEKINELFGRAEATTYELALRFVVSNPNIDCALSGMENIDMLEKNVKAIEGIENGLDENEHAQISKAVDELAKFSDLYCTGCRYCMPCAVNIDIPLVFQSYIKHNVYGMTQSGLDTYNWHINDRKWKSPADVCTQCGACKGKCPQKLDIPVLIKMVSDTFEGLKK